ncbi:MAG: twin-arginine translocase TatA/TatE family subunit [Planctomycetes bacterium]|nr:twin-arginine translocase TatA/TatE family subunit [Planctomycetota bacterium]
MGIGLHPMEILVIGVVAILLFGQKLPDVLKSLGKTYREFRSGLHELQSQVNLSDLTSNSSSYASSRTSGSVRKSYDEYEEPTTPKFEPPPPETVVSAASSSEEPSAPPFVPGPSNSTGSPTS